MTENNNHTILEDAGFTLTETLVAVLILSIVSLVSLGIFNSFAGTNQAMTERIDYLRNIELARNYIRDDLHNIANRPARNSLGGTNASHFSSEVDNSGKNKTLLLRLTRGSNPLATADVTISPTETIEYWLMDDKLIRRSYDRPDPTMDTSYRDYVILSNVKDVDIRFFNGNIWVDDWITGSRDEKKSLPRAVDFTWSVTDPQSGITQQYQNYFPMGGT